ncbi:chaperonin 10-like protein [Protomyces lactucae-debilis]|uniref:Chaperonin 10-like protein n=1 Tax=Protomyces lactucae-debilis TaxID=2754530 RepID=A0A1Y2EV47_PROLT|nr:chaperonin 10-like protein [Protomyces lactucae-debilis]ORY75481.1 chaperonin 10-like protein [Protomyces lactucae-debilis]
MAANAAANIAERVTTDLPSLTHASANPAADGDTYAKEGTTMQALAWLGSNHVGMVESKQPKLVDDHDVILKIAATTTCGSDLHLYHGAVVEMHKGDILGHEFAGIVSEVGSAVKDVKPGDRVVASFQAACGKCYYCKQKLSSQCLNTNTSTVENYLYGQRTAGMFGYSHLTGGWCGGQTEMVRVPFGDVNLLKLPDSVPFEKGLYLSDILCTSYHCVKEADVKEGSIVGIWGLGAIGLACIKWCELKGAKRIIVVDTQERLAIAKSKFPQVETIDFTKEDVQNTIMELTKTEEAPGLDAALDCAAGEYAQSLLHKFARAVNLETDTPEQLNQCITSCKGILGKVSVAALYVGITNGFNVGAAMQRGVKLMFNGQAPVHLYWQEILDEYIVTGKFDPLEVFVTHRIKLEDTAKAYTYMDEHKDDMIKCFIETRFSEPACAGSPALTTL